VHIDQLPAIFVLPLSQEVLETPASKDRQTKALVLVNQEIAKVNMQNKIGK